MSRQKIWFLKLRISLGSALRVFRRPAYIALAITATLFASGSILWSLNLDLLRYIIFEAPLSVLGKIDFFLNVYKDIYTDFSSGSSSLLVAFSIIFGINLALLVFVFKHRGLRAIPKKSGTGGFVLALIGGGCIACGTSVIAPLLATFGATTTLYTRDLATSLNLIGSLLIMYSIYKLGSVCSYIFASEDLTKD
jgi:hypothetical protein